MTDDDRARLSVTGVLSRAKRRISGRLVLEEAGFGLIEVMVAIVMLLVVLVPAAYMMDSAVQQSAAARQKVAATEVAEQALEQLGNDSLTTLEGELDTVFPVLTETVAGVAYKVTGFLTWQGVGSAPDLCSSGSPPVSISATATVSWGGGNSKKLAEQSVISPSYGLPVFYLSQKLKSGTPYSSLIAQGNGLTIAGNASLTIGADTSQTQVVQVTSAGDPGTTTVPVNNFTANNNYPVGTPVALPDEGYLAVQVNGVSGSAPSAVNQVTVQIQNIISGSSSQSYTPDSNGCVFAQELPGTYNVTLGSTSSPPFLNTSESPSPATSVVAGTALTVSAGSVTVFASTFDQAGNVSFTPSGTVPVAGGTPVSVLNSGIPGTDWQPVIAAGSSATSAYLFPFTSAYTVWYGDCLAEQPALPPTVAVTPGATASVPMTGLGNLTIEAEKTATGPIWNNASVSATIADPNKATDGCAADNLSLLATGTTGLTQAGMVETYRQDTTATWTNNSATVTDPLITTADQGKQAIGTGIPANSYIGPVVGTTFQLYSSPVTQTPATQVKTTASGSSVSVVSETYTVTVTAPDTQHTTGTFVVTPGGVVYNGNFYSSQGELAPGAGDSPMRVKPWRRDHEDSPSTESGFTLVEILITIAILGVVLAITTPVVTAFNNVNGDVQQSFTATNQLVLASETLTQYLHEAVAPCPTGSTKCSTTAFSSATAPNATSLTFYADTGNPNGPVQVVITTSGTTMTGAVYNPTAGTCPFNGSLATGCSYPTMSHLLVTVPNLTNVSSIGNPMFSYVVASGTSSCPGTTAPTASSILAVCVSLQANLHGGQPTGYQSLAFALASSYNGSVG